MLKKIISFIRNNPRKLDRQFLADIYIKGEGIEIGALHHPLQVKNKNTVVKYVDRMGEKDLRLQYPELKDESLVTVDYIADGELLETIKDNSQDFVIANHFIEHCQNTILTIKNMLRVIKPGGIIFFAVPDKRYTFDKPRAVTTLSHLIQDYETGPVHGKEQHFYEWATIFSAEKDEELLAAYTKNLIAADYSIHFHVWAKKDMDELLVYLMTVLKFDFEIALSLRPDGSNENVYILKKITGDEFYVN
jgi:predicted SAM-dependent methyltransferase